MTSPYLHGVPSLTNQAMDLSKTDENLPDFLTAEELQKIDDEIEILKFLIRLRRTHWELENNCRIFVEPVTWPQR